MSRFAGERIGDNYRLIERIGAGGMGSVWRARDRVLERDVAIKFLRSGSAAGAAKRLLREARTTARIRHPAVVDIFDCGAHDGAPYLVMELLRGEALGAYLERRVRLDPVEAVRLMLPVLEALAAAHGRGVVHRDLKPQNIFLCASSDGPHPKLFDFGLAKALGEEEAKHLTGVGQTVGSPHYMSPEQARAEPDADERIDVWAVCVVLYQCVTGSVPFRGESGIAILNAILYDDIIPASKLGCSDEDLWLIIRKGLEKDKEARISSIRALGEFLARWLVSRGFSTDVTGCPLSRRWIATHAGPERVGRPGVRSLEAPARSFASEPDRVEPRRFGIRLPLAFAGAAVFGAGLSHAHWNVNGRLERSEVSLPESQLSMLTAREGFRAARGGKPCGPNHWSGDGSGGARSLDPGPQRPSAYLTTTACRGP